MEAHLFKKGLAALKDMAEVEEVCTNANEQVVSILSKFSGTLNCAHPLELDNICGLITPVHPLMLN